MYEYKMERVELIKYHALKTEVKDDHHKLIDDCAKDGWRLAHIIPLPIYPGGVAAHVELVFERQKVQK